MKLNKPIYLRLYAQLDLTLDNNLYGTCQGFCREELVTESLFWPLRMALKEQHFINLSRELEDVFKKSN